MNVRLLRSRAFAVSCLVMFLFGFMLISTTQLLPQLTQTLLNYDPTTAGLTLGVGGLATLIIMPLAWAITGRLVQAKWLILIVLAGTGWALYSGAWLDLDISFWNIAMLRLTQVVWLPFVFIPLSAVSYVGVPPSRTNDASAMINLMRNLGGSVGVSFTTTMLEDQLQFHHERLAEPITAYNGYAWNTPLAPIDATIQAQAGIMSYLDIFWLLVMLGLCNWPLALLLPRMPKGAASAH
jgi:MFS transporter, DHA2 family, multidrug resistance protein